MFAQPAEIRAGQAHARDVNPPGRDYTRAEMVRRTLLLIGLVSGFVLSGPAVAQDSEDPPERVARVSFIRGDVTFQAADNEAPEQAVINRPVTTGDRLMTGNDARAELTLGSAALRLDARTDLSVANLDADIAHVEVNSGTVAVTLRALGEGETFEVDAPNGTVRLLEPGEYRVEVAQDGAALLEVRSGAAEIDGGSGPTRVAGGQKARLGSTERMATLISLGGKDEFDRWGEDRERQLRGEEPRRYVSRDVVGYEDLDNRYGRWNSEPGYGFVWFPTVVAGWSPYTFGRWTWISPWGWTWIDAAPWGFAPFHYGRWAHVRNRWCWVPGPRHRHAVYAPAHVAWVGHRNGFDRRSRPIGWYPLGPREVYVPGHRASARYLRNVNVANADIVNNAYITNVYRNRVGNVRHANRDVPGAFMTMPRDALASGQPVANSGWRSSPGRVSGWAPPSGSPDVEPLRRFRIHSPAGSGAEGTKSQSGAEATRSRGWRTQPSQAAEAAHTPPAGIQGQWRTAPREWGHGVRIPENGSARNNDNETRRNGGARTYGSPLPSNERTYGYRRPEGSHSRGNDGGQRSSGSPIRYGSPERPAAPRYSTPNTRGSDSPVSRQSNSSPSPPARNAAAPRAESSSNSNGRGSGGDRGGRAVRQSY
jgi:hypothetical protein